MAKVLVESCLSLSITDFKRALARLKRFCDDFYGELVNKVNKSIVSYWLEHKNGDVWLTLIVART